MCKQIQEKKYVFCIIVTDNLSFPLTIILLKWRIWWAPNNASRW